jgi:hypothetical protein
MARRLAKRFCGSRCSNVGTYPVICRIFAYFSGTGARIWELCRIIAYLVAKEYCIGQVTRSKRSPPMLPLKTEVGDHPTEFPIFGIDAEAMTYCLLAPDPQSETEVGKTARRNKVTWRRRQISYIGLFFFGIDARIWELCRISAYLLAKRSLPLSSSEQ